MDDMTARPLRRWPLLLMAPPAAVAIWAGWVGLGGMCGFGLVEPLPGIVPWHLDTAITLPVGMEAYAAYALGAWLRPGVPDAARRFARWSAIGALALGMAGQAAYHLLAASGITRAPVPVIVVVSCIPVAALGFGAALAHLLRAEPAAVQRQSQRGEWTSVVAPVAAAVAARIAPKGGAGSGTAPAELAAAAPAELPAADRQEARRKSRRPDRQNAAAKRGRWAKAEAANPGMSAADLAAKVGVHPRTVERWRGQSAVAEAEAALDSAGRD